MATVTKVLRLSNEHWTQIQVHASSLIPEEACGLVAGLNRISTQVFPVENELHSPVRFQMEPYGQLGAMEEIEEKGWEILAIYHSHPKGPPHPSPTDIAESYYPDSVNLICYLEDKIWKCRGFLIVDREVQEIRVLLEDPNNQSYYSSSKSSSISSSSTSSSYSSSSDEAGGSPNIFQ